jgi:hypothetical protein
MHKLVHATQSWEASKDVVKTVTQKTDAILPITSDKRTLEVVKVTAEMKVRNCKICSRNNRLGLAGIADLFMSTTGGSCLWQAQD